MSGITLQVGRDVSQGLRGAHHVAVIAVLAAMSTLLATFIFLASRESNVRPAFGTDSTASQVERSTRFPDGGQSPPKESNPVLDSSSAMPSNEAYSVSVNTDPASLEDVGENGAISYAFPNGKVPAAPSLPSVGIYSACRHWALQNGGADFATSVVEVVIASRSAQVIAESVQLEVHEWLPPRYMGVHRCGGGDILTGRYLHVDLGNGRIVFQYATLEDTQLKEAPFALLVKPQSAEKIQILATAGGATGTVKWRLRLNLIVDGARVTRYIDDAGEDFVTIGSVLP